VNSEQLVACGYQAPGHDDDDAEERAPLAFAALMNQVFARVLALPGDPLWLGVVEVMEPGSSSWLDALGDAVICLEEGANWWPGTERLSLGDVRVRALPAAAFGRDWSRIQALVGEGFYPAFDPFLFSRHPGGDRCCLETVGHEGIACCVLPEGDTATAEWLESVGFSPPERLDPLPVGPGTSVVCGVRSPRELAAIFGEESVSALQRRSRSPGLG
jgi:hypothetical protein